MDMKRFFGLNKKLLKNQRGNTILLALVSTVATSMSVYYLADYVIKQRSQVKKTGSVLTTKLALHSLADYVVFGVRQKYCFNSTLLPDANCNLQHSASVERLIMSTEQESFIKELIATGKSVGPVDASNISLSKIEIDVNLASMTSVHPLFKIFSRLNKDEFDRARVILTRDNRAFLPRAGREVFINMEVYLERPGSNEPAQLGGKFVTINSSISIHPREVGSFALVAASDLYLSKPWNETLPKGSIGFHNFKSKDELGNSPGLIFTSPVFVNGDIHLPYVSDKEGGALANTKSYTGVTFAERVVLGNGWVLSNGEKFSPKVAGATGYVSWSDHLLFGGFLKGIENDGAKDIGLDYFAKIASASAPNLTLYKQCIERNIKQSELKYLKDSKLWGSFEWNPGFYTEQKFRNMRLSLIYPGEYLQQEGNFGPANTSNWGKGTFNRTSGKDRDGIMELTMILGSRTVTFKMPKNGTVDLKADVNFPAVANDLKNKVTSAKASVTDLQNDIKNLQDTLDNQYDKRKDLEDKISDYENDLADLQADYKKETDQDKKNLIKVDIDRLKAKIQAVETQVDATNISINNTKKSINDKNAQLATAETNLAAAEKAQKDYQYKVDNPPEFTITTETSKWDRQNTILKVEYDNVGSMIDSNGKPVPPSIGVQAYDLSYNKYTSLLDPPNPKLKQYINFTMQNENTANPYLRVWQNLSNTSLNGTEPPPATEPANIDLATLDQQCEQLRNAMSSQSFGGAGWDADFSKTTRHSWNFAGLDTSTAGQDPVVNTLIMDSANSLLGNNPKFLVHSIVGQCIIKSTANFVSGFLSCDELIIEDRGTPLRIIASIITGKVSIHPNAFKSGIRWSTIYHPQATQELRNARILKRGGGGACTGFSQPIWHPIPSIIETSDRYACNAISLRAKANPFQWTSVDPDCGLLPGATNTSCKKRAMRFFVVEHSREAGL